MELSSRSPGKIREKRQGGRIYSRRRLLRRGALSDVTSGACCPKGKRRVLAEVGSAGSRERVSGGRAEGGTGAGAQEERRLKGPVRSREALSPVPSKLLLASPGYGSFAAAVLALPAALQGLRHALRHAARPAAAAASDRHPGRSAARSGRCRREGGREGGSAFGGAAVPSRRRESAAPSALLQNAQAVRDLSGGFFDPSDDPGLVAGPDAGRPPAREGLSP